MSQTAKPPSSTQDTPGAFPVEPFPQQESPVTGPQSISQAVKARRSEYITKKQVRIKVGTWNVASIHGTEKDLQGWFIEGLGAHGLSESTADLSLQVHNSTRPEKENQRLAAIEPVEQQEARRARKKITLPRNDVSAVPGGAEIGLYVLGLQELIDVSSASEALKLFTDPGPANKWKDAMNKGLPKGYIKVAEQQLVGLLLLVYASPEIAPTVSSVSSTSVGTGFMGYVGNKGGVAIRMVLGETTRMAFVNCHLAAGSDSTSLTRRNWDCSQIASRVKFEPITDSTGVQEEFGDKIGDEDFAFWFGDLNYRLEVMPGEDVRRLLLLHTRNEYDLNNKSKRKIDTELGYVNAPIDEPKSPAVSQHSEQESETSSINLDPEDDPASLYTTLQSLLPHDQLRKQMKQQKAFHDGWREGDINFLPTYKYDIGSVGMFDSGEKRRGPSWCDRILYRTRRDLLEYNKRFLEEEEARRKDKDMEVRGIDSPEDNDVLFDYDPNTDGNADEYDYDENDDNNTESSPALVETRNGFEDSVVLDQYTSHQRVLSSDHKPLDAVFTLTYDSVDAELRARVHQEVARELDKAENEGRPGLTIVIDQHKELDVVERKEAIDSSEKPSDNPVQAEEDVNSLNFGKLRFNIPKRRTITVANTGGVPASWYFADRSAVEGEAVDVTKAGVTPSWIDLKIEKQSDNENTNQGALRQYTLQPGETANIEVTATVKDLDLVRGLNEGKLWLEDVLLLRVVNGRDHFLPASGEWMPTCFGRSLEELTTILEGVRPSQSSSDTLPSPIGRNTTAEQPRLSAPRELFTLTEAIQDLIERAIAEQSMISSSDDVPPPWSPDSVYSGWPFDTTSFESRYSTRLPEIESLIRESLDTAHSITDSFPPDTSSIQRLEALCSTMMYFLHSLYDGIINPTLWSQIETQLTSLEKSQPKGPQPEDVQSTVQEILSQRPVASVCWTFIVFMLKKVLGEIAPPPPPPAPPIETLELAQPRTSESSSRKSADEDRDLESTLNTSTTTTPTKTNRPPLAATASSFFGSLRGRRARATTDSSTSSSAAVAANSTTNTVAATTTTKHQQLPPEEEQQRLKAEKHLATVRAEYARIFADLVIRWEGGCGGGGKSPQKEKDKERKARERRKRAVVEAFLLA
ncbi:MAG: hypothetical protein Q9160_000418 [Pyrenula sp. 1 TL-2023]